MAGINETLITIAVGSTSWIGSKDTSKPLSSPMIQLGLREVNNHHVFL